MHVAIVGGGMTGLSAAYELAKRDIACTIFERDDVLGGLAGSFKVNGVYLEKFYHHLYVSDTEMVKLIEELGLGDRLEWKSPLNSYYVNRIYRLSTPLDVLRFKPLNWIDRFRLGLLAIRARLMKEWRDLEATTARDWLIQMAGQGVYHNVWEPLLRGKFGRYHDQIAAVWFWNKLKLRGGSRGRGQAEKLGYLRGGFGLAIDAFEERLRQMGVEMRTGAPVEQVCVEDGVAKGVISRGEFHPFDAVLVTTAPAILLQITPHLPADYLARLEKIHYLANVCFIMKLKRSLSSTYWLNLNDPSIPFVAVVEHTNMQRKEEYGGYHLVYLSRYMDPEDPYYSLSTQELFEAYRPHLKKIFPAFEADWVEECYAWRELYTQPVIVRHYSQIKPDLRTPIKGLWLCCMAQVYPEDRGMNYALVYARKAVAEMIKADQD